MCGVIDMGADITILGGNLFKKVATIAKLNKRDFHPADKPPGTMISDSFSSGSGHQLQGTHMCTLVYVKMNVLDQLLLSKGVC